MQCAGFAAITGMFDATGTPLLERLIDGTDVSISEIDPTSFEYIGAVDDGQAQAGLFDELVIFGQNDTSLTLGPGVVLSSGFVTGLPETNTGGGYSNITNTGGNNYFRDFPAQTGSSRHGGRLDENDENSLVFDLDVPNDVQGVTLEFVYASEEFPEWSGTQFADGFVFLVDGVNYATLPDGRPVSLLRQEDNIHFMTNGDAFDSSIPTVANIEYDGLTRVLQLTAPLSAGDRNTITIAVGDTGDEIYDSAVFLSRFQFIYGDVPLPGGETGVKVRHSGEDDLFQEQTPEAGDFDLDGDIDGNDLLVWQRGGSPAPLSPEDLERWQNHYGVVPNLATASVPEPATLTLLLLALLSSASRGGCFLVRDQPKRVTIAWLIHSCAPARSITFG